MLCASHSLMVIIFSDGNCFQGIRSFVHVLTQMMLSNRVQPSSLSKSQANKLLVLTLAFQKEEIRPIQLISYINTCMCTVLPFIYDFVIDSSVCESLL